jgi:carbamoyltransferase
MRILGITALSHDASVAVIDGQEILFAAHSERYSRVKNDLYLNQEILDEALSYGKPDVIAFYERPYLKKSRQLYAGQYDEVFQTKNIFHNYFKKFNFPKTPIKYFDHHKCHAAASYFTSPYKDAAIVCIDAIGEWKTISIWEGIGDELKLINSIDYPHSLGLFYSAFTQYCDLKPNEDEYILMGMAGWGKPLYKNLIERRFFDRDYICKLRQNCHSGVSNIFPAKCGVNNMDIASSVQAVTEEIIEDIMYYAANLESKNLVYCGGVALNCLANRHLPKYFDDIWIMPNPGDSGSAIGAAALINGRLNWKGPYLGHNIEGDYPVESLLEELLKGNIVGVANGRAEFGPRAFGNRSLLADPRGDDIKDRVNNIKFRQKFRPFSPSILEEYVDDYFEMVTYTSPYMQYVVKCKFPEQYPAIVHVDGTSRVQTVNKKESPGYWNLINEFYKKTGCPMLLNTSLNIKGEPLVNSNRDAIAFELEHNIKVF